MESIGREDPELSDEIRRLMFVFEDIAKLADNFASDGVTFFLVHADPDVSAEAATKHAEEFQIKSPIILDSKQTLARMVKAKKTPEAHVIDREGRVRYCGRINDL